MISKDKLHEIYNNSFPLNKDPGNESSEAPNKEPSVGEDNAIPSPQAKQELGEWRTAEEVELAYRELPPNKKTFLDAFAEVGVINEAAKTAGVIDRTVRFWRENKEFAALFALAEEAFTQKLELELYRRALGIKQAKMSDVLLMFALKAKRPDVYREKVGEGRFTGEITIRLALPGRRYEELPEAIEGEYKEDGT